MRLTSSSGLCHFLAVLLLLFFSVTWKDLVVLIFLPQKNNEMSNELVVEGEDAAPMSEVCSRAQMDAIEELAEEEEEEEGQQ